MRGLDRRKHLPLLGGFVVGCALASLAVALGGSAVAQPAPSNARAVFEATHLPPLLTLPGEQVRLVYDVHCAPEGVDDPERGCDVGGTVFFRSGARGSFHALPLEPSSDDGLRQLTATIPADVATRPDGFEYYAEFRAAARTEVLVVPAGGADAPHRSLPLLSPTVVALGAHSFGSTTHGARIVSARWGDGPASVGLEQGRNLLAIGASAFDVSDNGTVLLLDEAHRRALRFEPNGVQPTRVPLSIEGHLADMTVDDDGSIYILESVSEPGRAPLVRRFDDTGRVLDVVETAERTPTQLRIGPDGPVVLQHPSHQWMPVADEGVPTTPPDQRRRGKVGRPLRSGVEVAVLRRGGEVLAALVSNGRVQRSWRITSDTPLAEVQLAEPVGKRFVLVARTFSDGADEFDVLVLDRNGLVQRLSTPSDEWAEAAPLGRFRVGGNKLYRLGSNASGAFVDRYDLETR